jgi:site-specific recombinase XerD
VNWDALWQRFSESGRRAESTLAGYRRHLNDFRRHYPHLAEPREVHQQHLYGWHLHERKRPGVSLPTATAKVKAVCVLLRWAVQQELLLVDPCEGFQLKKPVRPIPGVLSQSQVLALLEAPLRSNRRWIVARDLAILEVLYGTGLRGGELISLQLNDVDLSGELLSIRAGKGKHRLIPMGKRAALTLERYLLDFRPQLAAASETAVWLKQTGGPMSTSDLQRQVHRYGQMLGFEGVTPHALRRAFATHLLENGANIVEIKNLLGHADLNSTLFYAKVFPVELIKAHQKSHPRARFRRG